MPRHFENVELWRRRVVKRRRFSVLQELLRIKMQRCNLEVKASLKRFGCAHAQMTDKFIRFTIR